MYFPRGYDRNLAVELAQLVLSAYEQFAQSGEPGRADWNPPPPYRRVAVFTVAGAKERPERGRLAALRGFLKGGDAAGAVPIGFAALRDATLYLVFRGTKTPQEWVANLTATEKEYVLDGYGTVHAGFLEVYSGLRAQVAAAVAAAGEPGRVLVAGHSLGAALATLCVPELAAAGRPKIGGVYLFGSPRVGCAAFVRAYDKRFADRTFRISNTSDIVTQLPLPTPMLGPLGAYFSHVDTPVDFTRQDEDVLANHAMKTYLEEISRAREPWLVRWVRG